MKYKLLKTVSLLTIGLPLLSGCSGLSSNDFDIQFNDVVLTANVGEKYDFGDVLIKENGINYVMKASYYDYSAKAMVDLATDGLFFTPVVQSDVIVTITGNNSKYVRSKKTTVQVSAKGDEIDTLLATTYSSWADPGISKAINVDSRYVKSGKSSILTKFFGNDPYEPGTTIICPNNFRCLPYWSDQKWENAILTFWVYNPTDYEFEFQLRVKENSAEGGSVDIDWGDPKNTPQYAYKKSQTAGQTGWTQVFFSMNKIGINRPLYIDESGEHKDELIIKTKWGGTPIDGSSYSYTLYIDGIDVVDHSVYPDVDTVPYETLEQGWENLPVDTNETSGFGRSKVEITSNAAHKAGYAKSTKGLELSFANTKPASDIGYSLILSPEHEESKGKGFTLPNFNKGTIKADFKFENVSDERVTFQLVKKEGWKRKDISLITLDDLGDGWKRMYFDFAQVPSCKDYKDVIRFGFTFPGVTDANKATAKVYVDNIFFDQDGTGPAPKYNRGSAFKPGSDLTLNFSKTYSVANDSLSFDVKFTSDDSKNIAIMLFDGTDWDRYLGYFDLLPTTVTGDYAGLTVTKLDDGYIRYTFKLSEVEKVFGTKPTEIKSLYVRGGYSNATGFIDLDLVE